MEPKDYTPIVYRRMEYTRIMLFFQQLVEILDRDCLNKGINLEKVIVECRTI